MAIWVVIGISLVFLLGVISGLALSLVNDAPDDSRLPPPPPRPVLPPPPPLPPRGVACVLVDLTGAHVAFRTLRQDSPPEAIHRYHGRNLTVTYRRRPGFDDEGRVWYDEQPRQGAA